MTANGVFILLDRDGTVIEDVGYPSRIDQVRFLPGALQGLARMRDLGVPVFGATNQSGIGRGFFMAADAVAVNVHIDEAVLAASGEIKRWYLCPHRPEDGCDCRKPKPGLALQAQADWNLDLRKGIVIGDKASDMAFASNFGGRGILIEGSQADIEARRTASAIARNLIEAARIVEEMQAGRYP